MDGVFSKIPFLERNIRCYELTVKQYKVILKSLLTESITDDFITNINTLLVKLTNLTIDEVNELNVIEWFIILTFIRMVSIGSHLSLIIFEDNDKKINIDVNLFNTVQELSTILQQDNITVQDGNITVTIGLPTLKTFLKFNEVTDSIFLLLIKKVTINNNIFTDFKDIDTILNVLTPQTIKRIVEYSEEFITKIKLLLFYKNNNEQYNIPFLLTTTNILYLLKLVFGDNLMNIYNDIYYLSKLANISAEYLETCTPGEFKIFAKNLELSLKTTEQQTQETESIDDIAMFPEV